MRFGWGLYVQRWQASALCLALTFCGSKAAELETKYSEGITAFVQNRLEAAESAFRIVHDKDPDYKNVRLMLGKVLFYNGNYGGAKTLFADALSKNGSFVDALVWSARAQAQDANSRDKALEFLDRALRMDANNAEAWYIKGQIHESKGQLADAISSYRAALNQEKTLSLVHLRLAHLYKKADLRPQAENELQRAAELAAGDASILTLIQSQRGEK